MKKARSCKILYIDAEDERAQIVRRKLQSLGIETLTVRRRLPTRVFRADVWVVHWNPDLSVPKAARLFRNIQAPVILMADEEEKTSLQQLVNLKQVQFIRIDKKTNYIKKLFSIIDKTPKHQKKAALQKKSAKVPPITPADKWWISELVPGDRVCFWLGARGALKQEWIHGNYFQQEGFFPPSRKHPDWLTLVHPDDLETFFKIVKRLMNRPTRSEITLRLKTTAGHFIRVPLMLRTISGRTGKKPHYLIISGTGAANPPLTEDIVHTYIRQMGTLINNLPGAAYRCANSPDWTMEYISEGIEKITGYPADDFVCNTVRTYNSIILNEDQPRVWNEIQQAVSKKIPYVLEYRIRSASGDLKWVWERGMPVYDSRGEVQALEGFITDITERKYAEDSWRESERRFREFFETIGLFSVMLDTDGTILFCNNELLRATGWTETDVLGKNWFDLFIPAGDQLKRIYRDTMEGSQSFAVHYDNAIMTRNGERLWVKWSNTSLRDLEGKIIGTASIGEDITEKRTIENSLRERERQLSSIFLAAPVGIGVVVDRILIEANDKLCSMTGYSRNELIGQSSKMLYPTLQDFDYVGQEKYRQLRQTGTGTVQTRWLKKDGSIIHVMLSSSPIDPADWKKGVTFTAMDITERYRMETALRESEERFRRLAENSPDMIFRMSLPDCNYTYISPAVETLTGYTPEECYADPLINRKIIHEEWRVFFDTMFRKLTQGELPPVIEYPIIHKNGQTRWLHQRNLYIRENDTIIALEGIVTDFTELKQALDTITASEKRLADIIDAAPFGAHLYLLDNGEQLILTGANQSADRILNIHHKSLIGKSIEEAFPDLAQTDIPDTYRQVARYGQPFYKEQVIYSGGDISGIFEIQAVQTGPNRIAVFFRDITEKRKAEQRLIESEEKFRTLFETMAQGVVYQDRNGAIISANPAAERILGVSCGTLLRRTSEDHGWQAIHEDGTPFESAEHPAMIALQSGREIRNVVMGISNPTTNQRTWININAVPQFRPGETIPYQVYATFEDITERKQYEKNLQAYTNKLSAMLKAMPDLLFIMNRRGVFEEFYATNHHRLALPPEKIIGADFSAVFGPEEAQWHLQHLTDCLEHNILKTYEYSLSIDGDLRNYEARLTPLDADHVLIIIRDITENKRMTEALRQSEEKLRNIIENSSNLFYTHTTEHVFTYLSPQARDFFDCAPEEAMVRWTDFITDHPVNQHGLELTNRAIMTAERQPGYELELKTKTGRRLWVEIHEAPVVKDGKTVAIVGVATNISERKKSLEQLKESEERLRLLSENLADGMVYQINSGPDGNGREFTYISPAIERLHGLKAADVMRNPNLLYDQIMPADRSYMAKQEALAFQKQSTLDVDVRIQLPSGDIRWRRFTSHTRKTPEGNVVWDGIELDITERKKAEAALLESENRLNSFIHETIEGVSMLDTNGRIIIWNPAAETITGFTREEVLGRFWWDVAYEALPEEQKTATRRSELKEMVMKMLADKLPANRLKVEFTIRRKDGAERILEQTVFFIETITGYLIASTFLDITEVRKAEKLLKENEEKYRRLVELSPWPIAVHKDGKIFYINQAGVALLGYSNPDELIGQNLMDFVPPEFQPVIMERIRLMAEHKTEVPVIDEKLYTKNRSTIDVEVAAIPFSQQDETYFQVMFRDISQRKKTLSALEESERRYRRLIESVTDYIYTVQIENGRPVQTYHGPGCEGVTGYTPEEYAADPELWFRMIYDDDKPLVKQQMDNVIKGSDYSPLEHRIIHKSGSVLWVRNTPVPRFDDRSRLLAYDGLVIDITERKIAEEALRETEERFRTFVESVDEMVYYQGLDGRLSMMNSAIERITGYTLADIRQDPFLWQKNTHPDDVRFFEGFFRDHPEGLPYYEGEYRVRTSAGQWKWIFSRMFGVKSAAGRYIGYYCIDRDITDRKRYELQLIESEQRYRNLVETYPDAVIVEIGGKVVFTNTAGLNLFGCRSLQDMENVRIDKVFEEIVTDMPDKTRAPIEFPILVGILTRQDGQHIEVEMVISQTTFMNQPAILRIIRDVSEINQLHRQSRRMEQLAALGQMAATIAHEIRNPLGAVSLNFQFLFHELSEMQKYRNVFRNIEEGIGRIQNIITGILDYSRPVKPQRITEHLHAVIDRSVQSVEHEFRSHRMTIEKQYGAASDVLSMDIHQIMRVFINLLTNARQAMTDGGRVIIATRSGDHEIIVTVTDTGRGIEPHDLNKVFNPFFTTRTEGSGLGLAIVYRILEQHDAKISVESALGQGTVFTIRFAQETTPAINPIT